MSLHRSLLPLLVALVVASPARADEGPLLPVHAAPTAPGGPVLPADALAPANPTADETREGTLDLLGYLAHLRAQLAQHAPAPARTRTDHALYDIWRAHMRPRVGRMLRRIDVIADPARWIVAPETGRVVRLDPAQWSRVAREAAALYVELGGALKGYERATVRFTSPYGIGRDVPAALPRYAGHPLEQLGVYGFDSEFHRRLHQRRIAWTDELNTYWRLLGRVQYELIRSAAAWRRYERDLARQEALDAAVVRNETRLAHRRDSLRLLMLSLRTFVSTVQAAEEDRLRGAATGATLPAPEQAAVGGLLAELRSGRLAAREHDANEHAAWGSILRRRWLAVRARLLRTLP